MRTMLIILSDKLQKNTKSQHVILKLNQQGILINSYKNKKIPTSKLEALNSNPIDVAGAGDSLLIATTLDLCSGGNIYESSYIGSIAAALQVGQTGNLPLKKITSKRNRRMQALILAAGLGTRLKPITNHTPKCLVEINGRKLIDIWLEKLSYIGVEEYLINTHHLSEQVEEHLKKLFFIQIKNKNLL